MKIIALILIIIAFIAGYQVGYKRAYTPLHDKLQAIQGEDWQFWNKLPANQKP